MYTLEVYYFSLFITFIHSSFILSIVLSLSFSFTANASCTDSIGTSSFKAHLNIRRPISPSSYCIPAPASLKKIFSLLIQGNSFSVASSIALKVSVGIGVVFFALLHSSISPPF
ncbi:hypothetical protein MOLA814_02269 [Betaproteobacteria bacterium MOLA814]|nr:hypothetical protein MOLA814_02269 [Betaproteobacteria bacterium MOLA814]